MNVEAARFMIEAMKVERRADGRPVYQRKFWWHILSNRSNRSNNGTDLYLRK